MNSASTSRRIGFVTNICPHYRVRTFEMLAERYDVDYYFFSSGDDWYWRQEHGIRVGHFRAKYLSGFRLGQTRITPSLPILLWQRRYDVYIKCINGRFALPITYLAARLARRPFVLWTGLWMRIQTPAHKFFYPVTRYIYRHADAVVTYGDHVRRFLEAEGVAPQKIFAAPHAIDNVTYGRFVSEDEIAAVRQRLRVEPAAKIVLFIGRLEHEKGLSVLLEAFASLRAHDSILVLAGEGSLRAVLEQLAVTLGIEQRVRFPGYVQPDDTVSLYAAARVYVLPSVTTKWFKEPWGLVVNEAFNQGLPVVATDAVGAAAGGLIRSGENGWIVPEGQPEMLAAAVETIVSDDALRERMSLDARNTIRGWNNDAMVGCFGNAIEYAVRSRGR